MIRISLLLFVFSLASTANAASLLVPVFSEQIEGINQSVWQSELRIFNPTSVAGTVRLSSLMPYGGSTCTGFAPITVPSGDLRQIRSIGCTGGGAAAVQLLADDGLDISAVTTNVAASPQDDTACCLSGFTQQVPVIPETAAYRPNHTIAHLQVPVRKLVALGRHNLGIVNPNTTQLTVQLTFYEGTGQVADYSPYRVVLVPPKTLLQVNDILPQPRGPFENPTIRGYFRVEVSGDQSFYVYDSYVDNTTNDATTLTPVPR